MKKEKTKMKKKSNVEVVEKSRVISEEEMNGGIPAVVDTEVSAPVEDVPNVEPTPVEEVKKGWFGRIIDKVKSWPIVVKISSWSKPKKYLLGMVTVFLLIVLISELVNLIIK